MEKRPRDEHLLISPWDVGKGTGCPLSWLSVELATHKSVPAERGHHRRAEDSHPRPVFPEPVLGRM
ncbi:rCG62428 [Rattus norvegicus]|uniref:RCG62428 n=1 Tax=Rattus norvegicus TaxID=10116 RepID=A6HAV0_RAT|nr:rCG62428 [Rattus norvegicus]